MSEVVYSKRQMQPLFKKFGIEPETNTLFQNIIALFPDSPNYQFWAVKAVFNQTIEFEQLNFYKAWIEKNGNLIKKLSKKNVTAYNSKADFKTLNREMEWLGKLAFVKSMISQFNTEQKHILEENLTPNELNGITASANKLFVKWYDIFYKFSKLTASRKRSHFSNCSRYKTMDELTHGFESIIDSDYNWDKEDFLAFVSNNTPNCNIILDSGPIVILEVPSFKESVKLCGNGRTNWCIATKASYFNDYVTRYKNRKQYFYFDFSKAESDELAHIGFTMEVGGRIVEAQTCKNHSMMSGFNYRGKSVSIDSIFQQHKIETGMFVNLAKIKDFEWKLESLMNLLAMRDDIGEVLVSKDGRVIIKPRTKAGIKVLLGHTFINTSLAFDGKHKGYVLLDFHYTPNKDNSACLVTTAVDRYGAEDFDKIYNAFGKELPKNYISNLGIDTKDIVEVVNIKPEILLHKYINEKKQNEAIELIQNAGDDFDINYEFENAAPIFGVITNRMSDLFNLIINHKNFNATVDDSYGEPLLQSLTYAVSMDEIKSNANDYATIRKMLLSIASSRDFNVNITDCTNDTALHIAAEVPEMNWFVEVLAKNPNTDINMVDTFNLTPLGSAIENGNIEAIKILGKRKDLVVRESDIESAKLLNINLKDYIKPDVNFTDKIEVNNVQEEPANNYEAIQNIFSGIFSK